MNNRIMAMLFALVAAMFISIVPVKAEAAHSHVDKNKDCICDTCNTQLEHKTEWKTDALKHRAVCTICKKAVIEETHDDWIYTEVDGASHTAQCRTCGYKETQQHTSREKECRCKYCLRILDHVEIVAHDGTYHWNQCSTCTTVTGEKVEHSYTVTSNGNKTHKKVCETCGLEVASEACQDSVEDADCVCDACGTLTGHTREEVAYKAPTCTAEGNYKHFHCTVCDKYFEHTSGKETTLEKLTIKATGHDIKGDWSYDAKQHWHECSKCGDKEKVDLGDHSFKFVDNGDDTHTGTCEVCKKTINATTSKAHVDENNDCVCDAPGCGFKMHDCEWIGAKEKTCTEKGWATHWKCKKCGNTYSETAKYTEVDPFIEASHDPISTVHTDDNGHWQVCRDCKQTVNYDAHTIKYVSYDIDQHTVKCENAKCTYKVRKDHVDENKDCVCDLCERQLAHTTELKEKLDPTCTNDGYKAHYLCTTCKGTFNDASGATPIDIKLEAVGHSWTDKGYTLTGLHERYCTACQKYQSFDHKDEDNDCYCDVAGCTVMTCDHTLVYMPGKVATCTEDGVEAHYKFAGCGKLFDTKLSPIVAPATQKAKGHTPADKWVPGENGQHVKKCVTCGEIVASEDHNFSGRSVTCTVCGAEEGLTHVAAKAATCTEAGNIEYWYSKTTGKQYSDAAGTKQVTDVNIAATGHAMSGWQDAGNGHKQVCMNDGCAYELTENHSSNNGCSCAKCGGSMQGHTLTMVEKVPATCDKAGTQAHFQCSCGKLYDLGYNPIAEAGTIEKLNHNYVDAKVEKDVKAGKHYMACNNCGYKTYEEHVMAVSDPLKGNYHQWICECGELEVETHYDKNGDNKCDVCDHSMNGASQNTKVEQHDNQTVYTGQSDKVEPTKNWWWNWQEFFTPSSSGGSSATTEKNNTTTGGTTTGGNTTGGTTTGGTTTGGTTTGGNTTGSGTISNNTTTPTTSQTSVIVQFINWFLGLFGF